VVRRFAYISTSEAHQWFGRNLALQAQQKVSKNLVFATPIIFITLLTEKRHSPLNSWYLIENSTK